MKKILVLGIVLLVAAVIFVWQGYAIFLPCMFAGGVLVSLYATVLIISKNFEKR